MTGDKANHPAKVRVAIRVGVTGHRPNRLGNADHAGLRHQVHNVLNLVRETARRISNEPECGYEASGPLCRVISPLAEGSDRLVAEEALKLGFELQCPMPFPRDDYERDFATPESRKHFRDYLEKATAVLELDGSRESAQTENHAYENAGRTVLRHSDLLIAIWNGERAEGRGGTAQIVKEAVQLGIPLIWIRAESPHSTSILVAADSGGHRQIDVAELPTLLDALLQFRDSAGAKSSKGKNKDPRKHYFKEKRHTWTLGVLFRFFTKLTAGLKPWPLRFRIKEYEKETKEEWNDAWAASPTLPPPARHQVEAGFLHHYAWADKLANHYGNIYRSSFVVNFLLAACAVMFALLTFVDEHHLNQNHQKLWIGMELGSIIFIIVLTKVGRTQRWHERWIDYRLLAEKFRQMRFLFLIGRGSISSPTREHDSNQESGKTWVEWHFHAVARAAGLPKGEFSGPYRSAYWRLLVGYELPSQIDYHLRNSQQFHKVDHRLHWLGTSLFFGTLVVCIAHFFDQTGSLHVTLVRLAAILPAFGAAIHGIASQGDFHKVAQRSAVVNQRLDSLMKQLEKTQGNLSSEALGDYAEKAAEIMGAELIDWRAGFQEKPLVYPS